MPGEKLMGHKWRVRKGYLNKIHMCVAVVTSGKKKVLWQWR
ncbi:MAG TPA: hypothetical protein VNI77_04590 [Nitrososphaera sp.]|nr:hypothetical protein [Nitrososphaera sp.]